MYGNQTIVDEGNACPELHGGFDCWGKLLFDILSSRLNTLSFKSLKRKEKATHEISCQDSLIKEHGNQHSRDVSSAEFNNLRENKTVPGVETGCSEESTDRSLAKRS